MTMTYELQPRSTRSTRTRRSSADLGASSMNDTCAPETSAAPTINLVVAAALAFAIIAALVGFGGDAAANGPLQPASAESELVDDSIEIYIVQPGDTLWGIATEVGRPGEDIRPIVDALKTLTGGSQLDIGQRIVIDHATIRG